MNKTKIQILALSVAALSALSIGNAFAGSANVTVTVIPSKSAYCDNKGSSSLPGYEFNFYASDASGKNKIMATPSSYYLGNTDNACSKNIKAVKVTIPKGKYLTISVIQSGPANIFAGWIYSNTAFSADTDLSNKSFGTPGYGSCGDGWTCVS